MRARLLRLATIALTTAAVAACASRNETTSSPAPASQIFIERMPEPVDPSSFVDVTATFLGPKLQSTECPPESFDEARKRYERGLQLYEADDYERVRIELERAFALCPSVKILYSLARVCAQLNDNARAHALYEKYLEYGEPRPERVAEIRDELARIEKRLGWVLIECGEGIDHAFVDDRDLVELGPCPFRRKFRTDPGKRVIRVGTGQALTVEGSGTTAVSLRRGPTR